MCGFAGFLTVNSYPRHEEASRVLERMADKIMSRGPDDFGHWTDGGGIGLTHRRLSVIDLSPAGHQPMSSDNERYVIAFNGEIYNHLDLRAELVKSDTKGMTNGGWRGHSDTETLLAGFVLWGIKATIERCIGMFAFAVWDKHKRVLTLGRDRMGEKPLYYGWQGQGNRGTFLFGSEIKALKVHPEFSAPINRDALALLMRHNYIPAPHSIFCGIYKLQPGCLLTLSRERPEPEIEHYWSLADVAVEGNRSPLADSPKEMVDQLERLLNSTIRQQMMADVPLGAFLSGGIDSSTVVALMQAQSTLPVKTFTIGFHEKGYNEAEHAKAVAHHLGTEHTEMYVSSQQALDVIPKLPSLYCEPFADSSQIPTFLISQLARQQVTVSLSGDGGDELFAGYNRYVLADRLWNQISLLPHGVRSLMKSAIRSISPNKWNIVLDYLQTFIPAKFRHPMLGNKLYKGADVLDVNNADDLYFALVSHWAPVDLVIDSKEPMTSLRGNRMPLLGLDPIQRMMALDAVTYLPDDILVKIDRAAMGVSLEGRVPFLDHRVVEFAWRLPQGVKLHDGVGKWILRQVLYRHVPKELIERPKMGFGVPIDAWLRGPLRDWAETLLDEGRLRKEGYLNPSLVRFKWNQHLSGKFNWQYQLWNVLMFQAWLEEQ